MWQFTRGRIRSWHPGISKTVSCLTHSHRFCARQPANEAPSSIRACHEGSRCRHYTMTPQLKLSPKRRSFSTVKRWLLHLADFQCVLGRGHELCIELSAPIKSTDLAEMVCAGICIMDVYVLDFPGPEPVTKRNQNTRPKLMKHAGPDASLWHKSNIFMTKWFFLDVCVCLCVCVAIMSHK